MHRKDRHAALRIHLLEALAGGECGGCDRLGVGAKVDIGDLVAVDQLIERLLLAGDKFQQLFSSRARLAHVVGRAVIVEYRRGADPAAGQW